jgi:hypothetical protein
MTWRRLSRCIARFTLILLPILAAGPAGAAPAPEEVALQSPWFPKTISAGGLHTCGLKTDGTLACWGHNAQGQATPPAGTFTQASAGNSHTCGVKTDGTLACWGANDYGQTTPPAGTFTQISAGDYHNCGVAWLKLLSPQQTSVPSILRPQV